MGAWWRVMRGLVRDTMVVWWRVLPQILVFTMVGWFCYQLGLLATRSIQETHPWLTVVVFSTGLVIMLATMVISLRIAGTAAGVWEALPDPIARAGREEPLTRVVSVSLLPFIGIYSVFGGIDEATNTLAVIGAFHSETYAQSSAAWVLDPMTARERLVLGAIIVGSYLLRRGLETAHERWDITALGIVGALVEGFFSVVLVFGGSQMLGDLWIWLSERVVAAWWESLVAGVMALLASLHDLVPRVVEQGWAVVSGTIWPLLTDGVLAPLLWLAAAGLVHGSYTLSLAELWDERAHRVKESTGRLSHWRERGLSASHGSRAVVLEVTEVFFGDVEDRILPFIQSARYVLRVGWVFLGAYVLAYGLAAAVQPVVEDLGLLSVGGREFIWWSAADPFLTLTGTVLGQPLVVCLLAVALTATINQNRETRRDENAVAEDLPGATRWEPTGGRRLLQGLPVVVVTVASLVAASAVSRVDLAGEGQIIRVDAGQVGWFTGGQSIEVVGVQAGTVSGSHEQMTSSGVFLAVDVRFTTRVNEMIALRCFLVDSQGDLIGPVNEPGTMMPEPGFRVTRRYLFERPVDELVDTSLRCSSSIALQSYQPVPVVDLGLDAGRVAELISGASGRVVDYSRDEQEVIR